MNDNRDHAARPPEGLGRLLAALHEDPDAAAERYVLLQRKLLAFFEWRGAHRPDECVDRTIDTAVRRLAGGEPVRDISSYCGGIARMVLLESLRQRERERSAVEQLRERTGDFEDSAEDAQRCAFEQCLEALPARDRHLIIAYYADDGSGAASARQQLAGRIGIPLNALRIRAYRVRARLESAVREALNGSAGKTK